MLRAFKSVVVLGSLVAVTGCGKSSVTFNNSLSEANQRIAKAGEAWGLAAAEAIDGDPSSIQRFKAAQQSLQTVLADVKADMQALQVPDSPTAKRLYEAHQQFLRGQEEIMNNQFAEIGRLVEDTSVAPEAKAQRFMELAMQAEQIESRDLVPLQQVQRQFASENGFQLRE